MHLDIEKSILNIREEIDCPIKDFDARRKALMQICAMERVTDAIQLSTNQLDQYIKELNSGSEQGIRALKRYISTTHSAVLANIDINALVISKIIEEDEAYNQRVQELMKEHEESEDIDPGLEIDAMHQSDEPLDEDNQ
ncbi:hypothetical protein CEW46_21395 [Bacillus cereus]|nr:hypothetical protein CEW46_21395 [Bacillus cereus]